MMSVLGNVINDDWRMAVITEVVGSVEITRIVWHQGKNAAGRRTRQTVVDKDNCDVR